MRRSVLACLIALALTVVGLEPAMANVPSLSTTRLASRTPDGRLPNGPSHNPAISNDRKVATYVGYDSTASDIVPGDTNGASDVFVIHRADPYDPKEPLATRWEPGST